MPLGRQVLEGCARRVPPLEFFLWLLVRIFVFGSLGRLARASGLGLGSCCRFSFSAVGEAQHSVLAARHRTFREKMFPRLSISSCAPRGDGPSSLYDCIEKPFDSVQYPFQLHTSCERVTFA